jgi:tripartite-type tricarboxylate transporter receptor subunit TctC
MLLAVPSGLLAHVKSGRVRALAVSGSRRLAALPELPTLQESGVPVVVESFWGVVAPAGIQPAIAARLQQAIERALRYPEIGSRLDDLQFQPVGNSPAEFEAFVQSEVKRWIGVVKATGVKAE